MAPALRWGLLTGALGAAVIVAARLATGWLLEETERPVPADLIVVLSGGSSERTETALVLFEQGLAPRILITDGEGFPDPAFRWLEAHGVPHRALMAPAAAAASTLEDALCVRAAALQDGYNSVLVVTSPYHCRRARAILKRVLEPAGVKVTVVASASYYMDARHWWRAAQGWRLVPMEFVKLIWWRLTGVRQAASGPGTEGVSSLGSA